MVARDRPAAALLSFDRFQGSSPRILAVLGVLTIIEHIALGSAPTIDNWSRRFSIRARGRQGQFDAAFPSTFKNATAVKEGAAAYDAIDDFLAHWIAEGRTDRDLPDFAPRTPEARARYAELVGKLAVAPPPHSLLAGLGANHVGAILKHFCRDLEDERSPSLPLAPAFSVDAVKTALYGLPPEGAASDPLFGLYPVIREARGWVHHFMRPGERCLIVRDLIWITPKDEMKPSPIAAEGYYFSAYDNTAYTLKRVNAGSKIVRFEGEMMGDEHQSLRFDCNDIGARQAKPHIALLVGSTRNASRPAAWKALVRRGLGDRGETEQLLRIARGVKDEGERFRAWLDVLRSRGRIGVIPRVEAPSAWEQFRRLTTLLPISAVESALKELAAEAIEATLKREAGAQPIDATKMARAVVEDLSRVWPLLEPPQTILSTPDEFAQTHPDHVSQLAALFEMPIPDAAQ